MRSALARLWRADRAAGRALDHLQPLVVLFARCYVSWQFMKSGWIKLNSWDSTLYLFANEYHTPVLSPHLAAIAGTCGELLFPTLLILGLASRCGAAGLFAVNALAVISYAHVLLAPAYAAALAQHVLWGSICAFLVVFGPGKLSMDHWLGTLSIGSQRPQKEQAMTDPAPNGLVRTESEWQKDLSPETYRVMRKHGTERAGTSPLNKEYRDGLYSCAACGLPLFESSTKFDSGTGWPSFFAALPHAVGTTTDRSLGMARTEVHCARCAGHLGHVFPDGPRPTGKRFCVNGVALEFEPK